MVIIPSIEEEKIEEFTKKILEVSVFGERVHIDFNDGSFLGFKTILPEDIQRLPDNLFCEAHLMVTRPSEMVPTLRDLGFTKIPFASHGTDPSVSNVSISFFQIAAL